MALQSYPAFIPKEKNLWRHHLLLRVNPARWERAHPPALPRSQQGDSGGPARTTIQSGGHVYEKLKTLLSSLDSSFTIIVDPLSTL